MQGNIRVGVIGCGYWGPNLIRNFASCPATDLVAVCDADPSRLESVGRSYGNVKATRTVDELLEIPLDAVAIATPVSTHFALAERCLGAGLHVLIEKPLAASVREARALVELAERRDRVLMVDHTYLFGNPVRWIKACVESGELGDIYYIDSIRINLGLFQKDVNVVWDLAPHDLSVVDHVLGREARSISAWGCAHADPEVEDMAYVNLDYDDRTMVNCHVNWLSPVKVRQMIIAGSKKSLIFNELNTTEPIKVYNRGIDLDGNVEDRRKLLISYRSGDVLSPHLEPTEALQAVVSHFAECVRDGKTPISDGRMGLRVVRLLESATRSIRAQGGRVVLTNGAAANGGEDARTGRPDELHPDLAGRPNRKKRGHTLLR
jgi:predicted dehydrogenase